MSSELSLFFLGYLEQKVSRFVNVTNYLNITIELVNNSQLITDSEDKNVRKKNKHMAKRKVQFNNLHASVYILAADSAAFLSLCPTLIYHPGSSALLLSFLESSNCLSPFTTCLGTYIALFFWLLLTLIP